MTAKAPTPMPEGISRPKAPCGPPPERNLKAAVIGSLHYLK